MSRLVGHFYRAYSGEMKKDDSITVRLTRESKAKLKEFACPVIVRSITDPAKESATVQAGHVAQLWNLKAVIAHRAVALEVRCLHRTCDCSRGNGCSGAPCWLAGSRCVHWIETRPSQTPQADVVKQ